MRNFQFKNKQLGLSLIEVLVSMGIATVAGVLLLVIMVNSTGLFSTHSSEVREGLNTNDALSATRKAIKEASAVAASYTIGPTTYTTGANQLVLKVLSLDPSNNIIENTYDYFVFYLDQSYFRFRIFHDPASSRKDADQILTTLADSLVFQYFNSATPPVEVTPTSATKVRVNLVLKQRVGLNFETTIATSDANLRND